MRTTITTIVVTAAIATSAIAEAPASMPASAKPAAPSVAAPVSPAPVATPPAPVAPQPAVAPTVAGAVATAPTTALTTAPAPAPASTAAPAPAPATTTGEAPPAPPVEKTYVIPTDGEVGQIINVINTICVPLVRGGNIDKLATPAAGFKKNKRDNTFVSTLVAKPYTLTLFAPGANKNVCRMALNYTSGEEKPIIVGLNIFSLLHKPELEQQRNDYSPSTDFKRITNTWEYFTEHESTGLVFLQLKKPDGTEVSAKWGTGEVLYSERQF